MNSIPFPLIVPIDEHVYQGYLSIHQNEYQIQVQLGPKGYLYGDKKLESLIQPHQDIIKTKLEQATSIMSFLTELREIIEPSLQTNHGVFRYVHDRSTFIFNELVKIGFDRVHHIDQDMTKVTFSTIDAALRTHLITFSLPAQYPLVPPRLTGYHLPVSMDITSCSHLQDMLNQHQSLINQYQPLFDCMDDLDQHMRILEPDHPTRTDCWRRIALGHHCSLEIELNPDMPRQNKPKVRFFGNANRVHELKQLWHAKTWHQDQPIHTNLLDLCQVTGDQSESSVNDVECGICYAYKLNGTDTPDIICALCNRGFHDECLYQWLRGNPSTTQSFHILFGTCPYCNQD